MKKTFKYLAVFLSLVLMGALTACSIREEAGAADVGLAVKAFFPTKVVAGQPMSINGPGLRDVTEIEFPGGVKVTNFSVVANDMIRVNAPSGIAAEGGKIIVRTANDSAESSMSLTLGKTVISGYSKQAGETADGGEQITIFGQDLEFINAVELLDADGNPQRIPHEDFYRKGTSSVIFTVPKKVFDGTFVGKVYTIDGQTFNMPELVYKPASDGGHWETVQTMIWENDGTHGNIAWSGEYRFASEAAKTGEEIYAIPDDLWALMMSGTFYLKASINADWYNLRITTGWWSTTWTGADIGKGDERLIVSEDGTEFILALNFEGDPILDVIDVQHLLFTGEGYTPLALYFEEEVWVGGGHEEIVKTSIWKNDGSHGNIAWSGDYRFASETNKTGEEIYAIPDDIWAQMISGTFYLQGAINADWYNLRITTGWWSTTWTGADIGKGDERLIVSEDGTTFTLAINFADDPILDVIDVQHLLFTGEGYTPLEIYFEETIWVDDGGGAAPQEVVIWENDGSHGNIAWSGEYRFAGEGHETAEEIYIIPSDQWSVIMTGTFFLKGAINADWYNLRITTGWWSTTWTGADIGKGDERLIVSDDGTTFSLEINFDGDPILDLLDVQHLLFTGEGYTPLKIYYLK